jgi:GT2 family glycosyltransferase
VKGPGLTAEEARTLLAAATPPSPSSIDVHGAYGCNMAVRMAPVRQHGLRFDPRLPLYGWQEDIDFSRQLAPYGRIVRVSDAIGVHLGVKLGRGSGLRLGYSQVANPLYIWGKRTGLPLQAALTLMGKNIFMNSLRAWRPESYIDRRNRLRGNLIALGDLARGRLDPERILEL